ncbi:MAG: HlyC/CorC family transporter [Victivallales bacterium]|nr:HlyC/CorC family transporter [Victivallales bacterium]
MDSTCTRWFACFVVSLLCAAFFALVCLVAGGMSGGKMKHLEESERDLADRLYELFPLKEEWVYAGHILVMGLGVLAFYCVLRWKSCLADYASFNFVWPPVLTLLLVYCLMEFFSALLSISAAARLLLVTLPIFKVLSWLLFPVTLPLGALARFINRRRMSADEDSVASVEDEILSLVEDDEEDEEEQKGEEDGGEIERPGLEEDERRMIMGALKLDEVNVRRIMTPRVEVTGVEYVEEHPLEEFVTSAKQAIVASGHSRIPVYKKTIDNVIGVVYSKDLLDVSKLESADKLIHRNPLFIPESKNIGDLLGEFQQAKIHLAVVVDEYGGMAGIVTFEDVLETLVGDIKDEYDFAEGNLEPREMSEGRLLCDARVPVASINYTLDTEIAENGDFDTLGGFITYSEGRIPKAGEEFDAPPLHVKVLKADHRKLIEVEISKMESDSNREKNQ